MAAASTVVAAVLGAGAAGKDGDLGKTYGRVVLQGWTLLDPNDQGLQKGVLALPAFRPQNPSVSSLFLLEGIGRALAASSSAQTAPSPKGPDN